jgi:hypothetical protein
MDTNICRCSAGSPLYTCDRTNVWNPNKDEYQRDTANITRFMTSWYTGRIGTARELEQDFEAPTKLRSLY